jgi:hypothetical protein
MPLAVRRAHVDEIVRVESRGGRTRLGRDWNRRSRRVTTVTSISAAISAALTVSVPTIRLRMGAKSVDGNICYIKIHKNTECTWTLEQSVINLTIRDLRLLEFAKLTANKCK